MLLSQQVTLQPINDFPPYLCFYLPFLIFRREMTNLPDRTRELLSDNQSVNQMQVCLFLEGTRPIEELLTTLCYLVLKSAALNPQLSKNSGAMTSVIVARSLIRTCNDGPAVSLNGSPTLHPPYINKPSNVFH
jgi:hypothetical protein